MLLNYQITIVIACLVAGPAKDAVLRDDGSSFQLRFMFYELDDGLCMLGGRWILLRGRCNKNNVRQKFVYDAQSRQIRAYQDSSQCIEGGTTLLLQNCDVNNINQEFIYDPTLKLLRAARKNNMCVDAGVHVPGLSAPFNLKTCDPKKPNQLLEPVYGKSQPPISCLVQLLMFSYG